MNTNKEIPILVVDDNVSIADLVIILLGRFGFQNVFKAESVDEAKKVIAGREEKFPLVITDLELGTRSGFEIIEYLRRESPGTKIIVMTGTADAEKISEVHQTADFLIHKPFERETLQYALEELRFLQATASVTAGV